MPANTGTGTYLINVGAVGITGMFIGMPVELMCWGLVSGGLSVALQEKVKNRRQVAASVLVSMFLAGALAPLAAKHLRQVLPSATQEELQVAFAILIGLCWTWAAPLLGDALKRLLDMWTASLAAWLNKMRGGK